MAEERIGDPKSSPCAGKTAIAYIAIPPLGGKDVLTRKQASKGRKDVILLEKIDERLAARDPLRYKHPCGAAVEEHQRAKRRIAIARRRRRFAAASKYSKRLSFGPTDNIGNV
jgi:hypothetical protein